MRRAVKEETKRPQIQKSEVQKLTDQFTAMTQQGSFDEQLGDMISLADKCKFAVAYSDECAKILADLGCLGRQTVFPVLSSDYQRAKSVFIATNAVGGSITSVGRFRTNLDYIKELQETPEDIVLYLFLEAIYHARLGKLEGCNWRKMMYCGGDYTYMMSQIQDTDLWVGTLLTIIRSRDK